MEGVIYFYQGKLLEEYSKEELIEMVKDLIDQRNVDHHLGWEMITIPALKPPSG